MLELTYVSSRAYSINDTPYTISVYRSKEGFTAFCDRDACADQSMKSALETDQDAAISECETQIQSHHSQYHK
jgi:hypothetical protein